MFRTTRTVHRWIGIVASLFFLVISVTGFLLAIKARADWIRPANQPAQEVTDVDQMISPGEAAREAFTAGLPELQNLEDIDRFEYQVDRGLIKITSNEGYMEVQVDSTTGEVLSTAKRNDQLLEDLHDLSWFSDALHSYWLPVVAVILFCLSLSGIYIFFVPVARRWRFKRDQATND